MPGRLTADDATLKSSFEALKSFQDVAMLLEIPPNALAYTLHGSANYKRFEIRKRSGGKRNIDVPISRLKTVQANLNQVLQAVYGGRGPVHGFTRKKNIITNASKHVNKAFVLNFDLQDFFPTIHFGRVFGMFLGQGYNLPRHVAITLARICCHNGSIPQGAPTSPIISNMVCGQLDSQFKKLAIANGCTYTRYADDISFSKAHGSIPDSIVYRNLGSGGLRIGPAVELILKRNGFRPNPSKTRLLPRGSRQEVTGLIVNNRLNVKREYVLEVKATLRACKKWGLANAEAKFHAKYNRKQRLNSNVSFRRVLRGKLEFIGAVRGRDDAIYVNFLEQYLAIDRSATAKPILIRAGASNSVIERAMWVLEGHTLQGSAFALEGLGLVAAHHVFESTTQAACPPLRKASIGVANLRGDAHVDVARCTPAVRLPVVFRVCQSPSLKTGDRVRILGFPLYHIGNGVNIQECKITSFGPHLGVPHCVVDGSIVRGTSGGPILNSDNEVIGIAVKGQGTPGKVGPSDDLSRFVPIDFALRHL